MGPNWEFKRTFFAKTSTVWPLGMPVLALSLIVVNGCSSTVEAPAPLPEVPEYTKVRHPAGTDVMDLRAVFLTMEAPPQDARKTCDESYQKLKGMTANTNEVDSGVYELVSEDPVFYHWCFYAKLIELYDSVKEIPSMKDRQTKVLDTYFFLGPVAKTFHSKFNDSRYLRMAIYHYKYFSQWVFYRKLDVTPEMTTTLVAGDIKNPFGFYRPPEEATTSVLEKYGMKKKVPDASTIPAFTPVVSSPPPAEVRAPASPSPVTPEAKAPVYFENDH